mgnify:FL=1
MKKFFYLSALSLGMMCSITACSDDDTTTVDAKNLDYTAENASSWGNYMRVVAQLLVNDATALHDDWAVKYNEGDSYANFFKNQDAQRSVQQLIDGCVDIANEVGTAKIGDPYDLYVGKEEERALYAVESWYSWHSREDYRNNIYSIRNAYYGSRNNEIKELSLSEAVKAKEADLDAQVKKAISDAAAAIWNIPSPFRNNINSQETVKAMEACATLEQVLKNDLKKCVEGLDNSVLKKVVENYVDVVVLPTYADLKSYNQLLFNAVEVFRTSPSNANFKACAEAWLKAREPWETSEAFLFGPVADKGLDPNMDSWPLDQDGIVQILTSGNYSNLDWDGDYDEDDDKIAAAQALRGYHTLEYLIFKDGEARTIQ